MDYPGGWTNVDAAKASGLRNVPFGPPIFGDELNVYDVDGLDIEDLSEYRDKEMKPKFEMLLKGNVVGE